MDSILFGAFVIIGIVVLGAFLLILVHGERVGALTCPCRVNRDMLSTRLTVARESAGSRPPTVQLRVRVPLFFAGHRVTADQAGELAALLESAAGQLRQP